MVSFFTFLQRLAKVRDGHGTSTRSTSSLPTEQNTRFMRLARTSLVA